MFNKFDYNLSSLFDNCQEKVIKKGFPIMKQDETPNNIYYLKKGICYISSISIDGSENIFWYFKKGSFPCISRALTENQLPGLSIIAKTDCLLYCITREKFDDLFKLYPSFTWNILNTLLEQMNLIVSRYHALINFNTPSRVCHGLLDLAEEKTIKGKKFYLIDNSFSQKEIAKYVGVHYVTFSLIFKKLKELGIVERKGNGICIYDKEMLEHYTFVEELAYKDCRNNCIKS